MYTIGTVKYYNHERGYGFLENHLYSEDVFFEPCGVRQFFIDSEKYSDYGLTANSIKRRTITGAFRIPLPGEHLITSIYIYEDYGPETSFWGFIDHDPRFAALVDQELAARHNIQHNQSVLYRVRELGVEGLFVTLEMGERYKIEQFFADPDNEFDEKKEWWIEQKNPGQDWRRLHLNWAVGQPRLI